METGDVVGVVSYLFVLYLWPERYSNQLDFVELTKKKVWCRIQILSANTTATRLSAESAGGVHSANTTE